MAEFARLKNAVALESSTPAAPLESILCTEELHRRPSRPPDYEKENRALVALMGGLADSPSSIFQTLAETILEITQCDSAGLSLLTRDGKTPNVCGETFYWPAIAGMWHPHVGGGTPRNFGPCGDVLDQNRTLLFRHFERRYPYLVPVDPAAEECLLVPFYVAGEAVGTIWGIMHTERRKFDAEDDRVMASLGKFASSAYQALVHVEDLKFQVAEREKAETEVRTLARGLEAKMRRLVEANVVGIVMWNLEGAVTEANDAFLHMVQYDREDLASGRMRWTDMTPTEWRGSDERAIADLKARGSFQPFEKEYSRKDGSRVPVLLGGALFEGKGNEGVAFVLDLSEQKRAQENFRESEARLQAFFENTPNLIFLKDRQGRYLSVNKEFKRAFRITEGQVRGKKDDEIFSPEQAAAFQGNDRQVLEAGVPMEFEEVALQEDGQHTSIVQKFPLFNTEGEIYAIGGIVTDITERKKEESARRYSEERHRVVVETASDAVISLDETSTILLANPATTRIFGYDPAELIGKPLTILMPEFLRKLHEAGFKRYLATGQRHINWQGTELVGLRKNGQEFPVEVSFGELTKDRHRIFTGFIRDISERKQAQKAIQKAQAELARVSRLTTMGELAASMAHEVNQPLTAVNNNSNACLRLLANQNLQPDVLRRALEEIVADGTRASAIIARIRAFIKKAPAEKNRLDLNEVIGEVLVMMGHGFEENRILLQSELAQTLPPVLGDRVQLQQVLLNLIMNGIEAMSAVTDRPRLLCVQSRIDESGEILVAVRDSGTGLGSESDRVFTPFFTTKTNGMGMGLAISRSLVESHGGQLWATPHSPHGAIFSFTLPATAGSLP